MYTVTRYVANDGSEWRFEAQCLARDALIVKVADAMAELKSTPTDNNWEGYVQQDPDAIIRCRDKLFEIANTDDVLKSWIDRQCTTHGKTVRELAREVHPSWFGRLLDGGHEPLAKAYARLCAIDADYREWNQPYYALNPGTGADVCV